MLSTYPLNLYNDFIEKCTLEGIDFQSFETIIKYVFEQYQEYNICLHEAFNDNFSFNYQELQSPIVGNKINRIFAPSFNMLSFQFLSSEALLNNLLNNFLQQQNFDPNNTLLYISSLISYDNKNEKYVFQGQFPTKITITHEKNDPVQKVMFDFMSNYIHKDFENKILTNNHLFKDLNDSLVLLDEVINMIHRSDFDLNTLFIKDKLYSISDIINTLDSYKDILLISKDININYSFNKLKDYYKIPIIEEKNNVYQDMNNSNSKNLNLFSKLLKKLKL